METNLVKSAETYCSNLLIEKSPKQNVYHSLNHTREVVQAANEIALGENISPEDLELINISAWFHDTGYIEKTRDHEEISAMFASNFLTELKYDSTKIERIIGIIIATKVPQQPHNHLQQIMCDADLHHLGSNSFEDRNNLFRIETENYSGKKFTELQFITETIEFMNRHHYFTEYAKTNFTQIKDKNLLILKQQFDSLTK